ncbi:MAG: hypothetical protein IPH89_14150 [Bacteroidetes bacterium]|nr:hypothetical protein [Bacteroidota bacterium]
MTTAAIKKQIDGYLPLLTNKQQELLLEMVKSFLNVDKDVKRITRKQYNKEINRCFPIEEILRNMKRLLKRVI